jgi:hypothetical protein
MANLHPILDSIYKTGIKNKNKLFHIFVKGSELIVLDDSFDPVINSYSLEDILCSDMTPTIKKLIQEALLASIPILDEGVSKVLILILLLKTIKYDFY